MTVPIQLPKINPPIRAIGDPNPKKGKTHNTVNIKNEIKTKRIFEFLISTKYVQLFLKNSYDVISFRLNFEKKKYKNKQTINK